MRWWTRKACPWCKRNKLSIFFKLKNVPVFQNKVYRRKKDALRAKTVKINLAECTACGFVFNENFNENLMDYDESYKNEQDCSPYFQSYLDELVQFLLDLDFKKKKIVEIGCGNGYFLKLLKQKDCNVLGFDPTYEGKEKYIIKDYFSKKYSNISADLIVLRHTLEHIPKPVKFIKTITAATNFRGKIFIEVPDFNWIKKKKAFWDICYEHCNYFTKQTLSSIFKKGVTGNLFNNQYIYLIADLKNIRRSVLKRNFDKEKNTLSKAFEEQIAKYKKIVKRENNIGVWGVGAKGVMFANIIDPEAEKIKFFIDINPNKQNKFIEGTGHKICAPSSINFNKDLDTIMVMNENYLPEIKKMIDSKVKILVI